MEISLNQVCRLENIHILAYVSHVRVINFLRLPELFYQQCDYQPHSYTYCRPHGFVMLSILSLFCSSLLQLTTIHSDSGTSIEAT